jgi:TetR/AcrR family transcriptional regulator
MKKSGFDSQIEQSILRVALVEFHNKGTHGARMQHIADEAQVSKSMLHYYFVNKETLFRRVFEITLSNIFPKINRILSSDLPLFQKIAVFMNTYTDILFEHYHSSAFILAELATNTDQVLALMVTGSGFDMTVFKKQIEEEYKKGRIQKIDTRILFLNMLSLCVFPFVGIQVQLKRFNMNQTEYFNLLEQRKSIITSMIIESIKVKELETT